MTDSEKKLSEAIKEIQKKGEKDALELNEFYEKMSKAIKLWGNFGKEMRETVKNNLTNYFQGLLVYINSLETPSIIYRHLLNEKGKYEEKIIQAKINKDGYYIKQYEELITVVLNPLIERWEKEVKLEKEFASLKSEIKPTHTIGQQNMAKTIWPYINIKKQSKTEQLPIIETQNVPLLFGFKQIECGATEEQIISYFSILAKENNRSNDKPFMSQEDVDLLIRKNFSIFKSTPTGKYFDINLTNKQKGILRYFIYQFYCKYEANQIGTKAKYVNFLIWNFNLFKDDNPQILNSNMNASKQPAKNSIIPTEKYFKK